MVRPASLDHLRSTKRPVTDTVIIALDSDLASRYADAKSEYEFAKERMRSKPSDVGLQSGYADAEDAFLALHAEMEENSVSFTFRSIGREPYEELVQDNQPTKQQRDEARKAGGSLTYNPETFPPKLLAASSVEPKLTEAEAKELWNDPNWNQAELMSLFLCAMSVNQNRRVVDLGKG